MTKKELKKDSLEENGIELWSDDKIKAFRQTLLNWYDANKRDLPWRQTSDPYRIWVSEIMLQQTQVVTVIPYYTRFLETLPTIKDLAEAVVTYITSLNLNLLECHGSIGYDPFRRILKKGVENTIKAVGQLARIGMCETDKEIVHLMIDEK